MKKYIPYVLALLATILVSNVIEEDGEGDRDANRLKQGYWIYRGKHIQVECFKPEQIVKEGYFKDDRRNGEWKEFFCNGNLKQIGAWNMGVPKGSFKIYHENGKLKEAGESTGQKLVGSYTRFAENGQVIVKKTYNSKGKQEGEVKEYYDNGQLKVEYTANENGKPVGEFKMYAKTGELKRAITFDSEGKFVSKQDFEIVEKVEVEPSTSEVVLAEAPSISGKLQDGKEPKCDGVQKIYNDNLDILQDGEFKGCYLLNGKQYIYDEDGLLVRIEVYKNGKRHSVEDISNK